jgi:MIP family channel proteins
VAFVSVTTRVSRDGSARRDVERPAPPAPPDVVRDGVRRLVAEVVGTFFLVVAAAGSDMVADLHPGQVSSSARAIAPALVIAAMIYAFGSISGAHFNPAVSVAFTVRGVFPWRWLPAYVAAQLAGAVAAAGLLHLLFAPSGHQGTTYPHGSVAQSFGLEVLLTALLVVVVVNAANQHRLLGPEAALPVGATIAAAGLVGLAISGASMNPARSLGPAIVAGIGRDQWIYVVGPLIGAVVAIGIVTLSRGGPKSDEREAAEGEASGGAG